MIFLWASHVTFLILWELKLHYYIHIYIYVYIPYTYKNIERIILYLETHTLKSLYIIFRAIFNGFFKAGILIFIESYISMDMYIHVILSNC